jgi:hypothetical protein
MREWLHRRARQNEPRGSVVGFIQAKTGLAMLRASGILKPDVAARQNANAVALAGHAVAETQQRARAAAGTYFCAVE